MHDISKEKIIESYLKHQSIRQVGLELGISHETVRYYLKKYGALNAQVRYTCDEYFFSDNTAKVFYWAGFIAADGCVKLKGNKYKQLSVGLEHKDHAHVEKLKNALSFTGPVHVIQRKDCVSSEICISSDRMFDDLARFNIVPRKSLTYQFPEWIIGHELVNHFMRGYFDGDGSLYISKARGGKKTDQLFFALRGTKNCLTAYKNILEKHCDLIRKTDTKPRLNSGIYTLEYGGNRVVPQINGFLYKDSTPETRLDRKYEIAFSETIMTLPKNFNFKPVVGTNRETNELLYFEAIKDSKKYNFTPSMISSCIHGRKKTHRNHTWRFATEQEIQEHSKQGAPPWHQI